MLKVRLWASLNYDLLARNLIILNQLTRTLLARFYTLLVSSTLDLEACAIIS